jgi:hypothetical protein
MREDFLKGDSVTEPPLALLARHRLMGGQQVHFDARVHQARVKPGADETSLRIQPGAVEVQEQNLLRLVDREVWVRRFAG